MKLRTKMLLMVAFLVLAIPMAAGAARYKGDGAKQDATNGGWDLPRFRRPTPAEQRLTASNVMAAGATSIIAAEPVWRPTRVPI